MVSESFHSKVPEGAINARITRQVDLQPDKPVLLYFGELGVRDVNLHVMGEGLVVYKVNADSVKFYDLDANPINTITKAELIQENSNVYRLSVVSKDAVTIQWDSRRGKYN